jgi:hypothetical protein
VGGRNQARADVISLLIGAVFSLASAVFKVTEKTLYKYSFDVDVSELTRFFASDAVSLQSCFIFMKKQELTYPYLISWNCSFKTS